MIASDLDGTLLGVDGELTERTRKSLVAAREYGFAVVAVTARTPYGVDRLGELVPLLDTAICANGAILYEPAADRMSIRRAIEPGTARRVCGVLTKALPGAAIAIETGHGLVGDRKHYGDIVSDTSHWEFTASVAETLDRVESIVKIKVYDPDLHSEEMIRAVEGHDLAELDMCHWGDFGMLDFNAPGANKATGLASWCDERGLGPEDVVAFGDMPNDVPMLAWAGHSYAVEGAHPEALAAANDTTAANTDDGVARVIEALIERSRDAA
ncbi:Cof-type HAD-IIB family hydrolase [Glycomyces sp. L485]|uniref:HAD-IIB family hydrolase n=1 Tax=Glycomyces sp. L485 TaxID=2909235 RepID=UPI001F4AC3D3|nr:Cof-type HAD-IIB family hydrolase [Glycomyces sp. L485]